jgi:FMN-dependent NADH-azoreductase
MYITSPSKGGSTKNLLALLSAVTGQLYPNSKRGIETALHHIGILLVNSMTVEDIAAQEAERKRLIERHRAVWN